MFPRRLPVRRKLDGKTIKLMAITFNYGERNSFSSRRVLSHHIGNLSALAAQYSIAGTHFNACNNPVFGAGGIENGCDAAKLFFLHSMPMGRHERAAETIPFAVEQHFRPRPVAEQKPKGGKDKKDGHGQAFEHDIDSGERRSGTIEQHHP